MNRYAGAALRLTLIAQLSWMSGQWVWGDGPGDKLVYDGVILVAFAGLILTRGRLQWVDAVLRILIGLTFLGSVADRFGLLGSPGTVGISWGDFDHFVAYTRSVNAFLPTTWGTPLAILATICETVLGTMLVTGLRPRLATSSAALLLLLFGIAMTVSLGIGAQFDYAVAILAAGAWTLATADIATFELRGWLGWRPRQRPVSARLRQDDVRARPG